jgi:hypothetical protein
MKRTLLAMTAVAALAAAAPAAGQYRDRTDLDTRFDLRIGQLDNRIDAGIRAGTINRREAWRLRQQLRDIDRLEDRYALGGYSRSERMDLQQRLRALRQDVRVADRGAWDRNERYGYWDDEFRGAGGPYEEVVCERRGGVGGLIDTLTGQQNCYVVGDRVGSGLYAVPYDYRDRYRDRAGVYFRSDGRNVYEIDARPNTVIALHRMRRD